MPNVDVFQLLLVLVVTALTTLLVFVGIQVVYILREIRDAMRKVNKVLDDAGLISESVAKPIAGVSGFLTGIQSGAKLMKFLKDDKKWEVRRETETYSLIMDNRKHSDNSFLTGLVLGGVIGAALALVFGKEEGEEVREALGKKGKLLLKNLGDVLEESTSSLKQTVSLEKHWGEDKEEEEEKLPSAARKIARKFFHRNGKRLG